MTTKAVSATTEALDTTEPAATTESVQTNDSSTQSGNATSKTAEKVKPGEETVLKEVVKQYYNNERRLEELAALHQILTFDSGRRIGLQEAAVDQLIEDRCWIRCLTLGTMYEPNVAARIIDRFPNIINAPEVQEADRKAFSTLLDPSKSYDLAGYTDRELKVVVNFYGAYAQLEEPIDFSRFHPFILMAGRVMGEAVQPYLYEEMLKLKNDLEGLFIPAKKTTKGSTKK